MISPIDLLTTIKSRRSIRRFQPDAISEETLTRLLEAARWAPSAHNRQPWRFVVIEDSVRKQTLAQAMADRLITALSADGVAEDLIVKDTGRSYRRLTNAPILILVCLSMIDMDSYPDERRSTFEYQMAVQSTAMAAQNLLLMAHAEGLGAYWSCAPLFCADTVSKTLSLPSDYKPQGIIAVGYPDQTREKTRHPLETKVIFR